MHRRTYLATLGAGAVASTAGCSGALPNGPLGDDDGDEQSDTPEVIDVAAVAEWNQGGDLDDNRASNISISGGEWFAVAFEYRMQPQNESINVFAQAQLYDAPETRIASRQDQSELLVGSSEVGALEWAIAFRRSVLSPGEITANVQIQNDATGDTSGAETATFTATQ